MKLFFLIIAAVMVSGCAHDEPMPYGYLRDKLNLGPDIMKEPQAFQKWANKQNPKLQKQIMEAVDDDTAVIEVRQICNSGVCRTFYIAR